MADLPNRDEHERELSAALAAIIADHKPQWSDGLDAHAMRQDLTDELKASLALVYMDTAKATASELGAALDSRGAAPAWAATYATWLGQKISDQVRGAIAGTAGD